MLSFSTIINVINLMYLEKVSIYNLHKMVNLKLYSSLYHYINHYNLELNLLVFLTVIRIPVLILKYG